MPGIAAEKAPYIQFDYEEYGSDAEKSEAAGHPVAKIIPFVKITTDKFTTLEYPAEDWLKRKRKEAIDGKVNPDWVSRWEMQFEAWKKGEELPLVGQPIRTWSALRKDQIARVLAAGILTIEDLASDRVSQVIMDQIGPDARSLKDLAVKTLEMAHDGSKLAKEVADLNQSLRDRDVTIESLNQRLAALEAKKK